MKHIKNLPIHERPREKLHLLGLQGLTDIELLAILLRTGKKGKNVLEVAAEVLKKYPLSQLAHIESKALCIIAGIDEGKSCTVLSAFELARRAFKKDEDALPIIQSPEDVFHHCAEIRNLKKEYFIALFLDARNRLIHKETISIGTLNSSLVHPREVFGPAITHHAVAVIIAHNHPSGVLQPSDEDISLTKQLCKAGSILGLILADHLIVGQTGYLSMKEEGVMDGIADL